jgi:cytochrome c oxidase subunit IV
MSEHIVAPITYVAVWAGLLVLLAATIILAYVPLGPVHVVISTSIAFAKAILIVLFFMHVKYKQRLIAVFVCAGFFWLAIMFTLSLTDYMTRSWLPHPTEWVHIPRPLRAFE